MVRLLILGLLLLVVAGCKNVSEAPEPPMAKPGQMTPLTGTVVYIDLEGGFYGIESDEGRRFFPINLSGSFKEDGLRVRFTVRPRTDVMTTTMWGETCEIVDFGW